jgi:peptidoglycan/LPS O-acetylase OafA/YrhL
MTKNNRFGELDALRGFAAVVVVIFHFTTRAAREGFPLFEFDIGHNGVQVFFCISGFVIYWTLERSRTLTDFAVSRFSRLYPAYWAALVVLAVGNFAFSIEDSVWLTGYAVNATMLQKFVGFPDVDGVYWTLGVELTFYAWMAVAFATGQLKHIVPISLVWLVIAAWMGAVEITTHHIPRVLDVALIFPHIPYFIAGMMFYLIRSKGIQRDYVWVLATVFLAVLAIYGPGMWWMPATVFGIFALAIAGKMKWMVNPVTLWLGDISYSLYLTHRVWGQSVMIDLVHAGASKWLAFAAAIAIALALATAIRWTVELPALTLIRNGYKRFTERGTSVATSPRVGARLEVE